VLLNLEHRGACGCEVNTGDGAGILVRCLTPSGPGMRAHRHQAAGAEHYGVGMIFLPAEAGGPRRLRGPRREDRARSGQRVLGWRTVPTDNSTIGATARAGRAVMRQVIVERNPWLEDPMAFERSSSSSGGRRRTHLVFDDPGKERFYVPAFPTRRSSTRGCSRRRNCPLLPDSPIHPRIGAGHGAFAVSTNTFPNWARAHPYRYLSHNGEINTLRGNVNWMRARQAMFASPLLGDDLRRILPVIDETGSDSGMFDNALELLNPDGRSLPTRMMMIRPVAPRVDEIIITAWGSERPSGQELQRVVEHAGVAAGLVDHGRMRRRSSRGAATRTSPAGAHPVHVAARVLISPLCERYRYGCARAQFGRCWCEPRMHHASADSRCDRRGREVGGQLRRRELPL